MKTVPNMITAANVAQMPSSMVTVDGFPATVTFAGAAPQLVGVYQINLTIPQLAGSGPRALSIYQGGAALSQNLVRIYVQ